MKTYKRQLGLISFCLALTMALYAVIANISFGIKVDNIVFDFFEVLLLAGGGLLFKKEHAVKFYNFLKNKYLKRGSE